MGKYNYEENYRDYKNTDPLKFWAVIIIGAMAIFVLGYLFGILTKIQILIK